MLPLRKESEGVRTRSENGEENSGMDGTADISGPNPGLPLTLPVTLGESLTFCPSICLSLDGDSNNTKLVGLLS